MTRTRYGACPLSVRFGACPVCVRDGACPVCVWGRAFPLCVRFGACPVCVRGGVCPVCVRGRAFPLCVRFGACPVYVRFWVCPVCVRDGICPVCGMGGLSPVCRSWADCWSFFSLGCAGAGRRPRPRRNGARLPPPSSAPAVARCGAGAVVAFGGLDCHFAAVLFLGSLRREGVDPRHAGIGCRCARRMRRLPAALAAFARRG